MIDRDVERRLLELAAEIAHLKKVVGTFIAWSGSTASGSLSTHDLSTLLKMLDDLPSGEKGGSDDHG